MKFEHLPSACMTMFDDMKLQHGGCIIVGIEELLRIKHSLNQLFYIHVVPELPDLIRELQGVNNWVLFGIYLGVEMSRLEAIKSDCLTLEERRIQMLNEWQKTVTPTWSAVVKALMEMGMRRLASELAQKHG